jgi:hypothetical protein
MCLHYSQIELHATIVCVFEIEQPHDPNAVKVLDDPEGSDLFWRTKWNPGCQLFTELTGPMERPLVTCQEGVNSASVLFRVDFLK